MPPNCTCLLHPIATSYVRELPKLLASAPLNIRPARVPAAATAEPNASGWVADAYHLADYDPTLERPLWQAEHDAGMVGVYCWRPGTDTRFSCASGRMFKWRCTPAKPRDVAAKQQMCTHTELRRFIGIALLGEHCSPRC